MTIASNVDCLAEKVDNELKNVLSVHQMDLYRMMSYHLGWGNSSGNNQDTVLMQRNHGVACLAGCMVAGGDPKTALPAAASVEFLNGFCQIHDDVQSGRPKRQGRDVVWWVWGPAQAINAGDGMRALACMTILGLGNNGVSDTKIFKSVQLVDKASLELSEARFQELEDQERIDLSIKSYLTMAAGKSGTLYSCAMKLGAMAANADKNVVNALGTCGTKLGLSAQIYSDLLEIWPNAQDNETDSLNVLNKKKLLPIVYVLENADVKVKRRLGDIYFKRVLEHHDVELLRKILEENGAKEYCEKLVEQYRTEAESALSTPHMSQDGVAVVKCLLNRLLGLQ